MKIIQTVIGFAVLLAVLGGVWVVGLHPDWIKPHNAEEQEKSPETDVPVKTALVVRATLRQYVEGYGVVEPEPAMGGKAAAGANVAAPAQGIIAEVLCAAGQRVEKGTPLFQLDERLAKAQEEQAQAALESTRASLAKLKATPRPELIELGQLAVQKAKGAFDLAEKNYERQRSLVPEQVTSAKVIQAAETELNSARVDLQTAEKQLAVLKSSPTAEELVEATAKVHEAERAVGVAQAQRSLLKIESPMAATVLRVGASQGEAVDSTKVLAELVSLDRLILNATVSARDLRLLKAGQAAEIALAGSAHGTASAAPHAPATRSAIDAGGIAAIRGEVKWVGLQVDRKTDSAQVWISVPQDAGVRPGQYMRMRIVTDEHTNRLVVPSESVFTDADGHAVISVVKDNEACQQAVQTGLHDGNLVEITGEVQEGDVVVTEGAYGLPKKTKVHVIGG
jgi:RND family efflux transporter MFP subunit